jgi:chemotaxis protein methyltransferase CheR
VFPADTITKGIGKMAFTFFFRDLQTLELIREHALPTLKGRSHIDIWDAGCAMGPEPYTLAIIIRESMGHFLFRNVRIFATDVDGSNLFGKTIEDGIYPREMVERIPKELFDRYFEATSEKPDHFIIREDLRKCIRFERHDLLSLTPPRTNVSLILCKNVLLHFSEQERIEVMSMFHETLDDGGYFVTEQTQKLPEQLNHLFEPIVSNAQIFRKVLSGAARKAS